MKKIEIKLKNNINDLNLNVLRADVLIHSGEVTEPTALISDSFSISENDNKTIIEENLVGKSKIRKFKVYEGKRISEKYIIKKGYDDSHIIDDLIEIIFPQNYSELNLNIDGTSSNITIENLVFNKLVIDNMNGDITLTDVNFLEGKIDTMDGDVVLKDVDFLDSKIETMSGDVHAEIRNYMDNFIKTFYTMSGDITFEDMDNSKNHVLDKNVNKEKSKLEIETMSGDIKVLFKGMIK